MRLRQIHDHGRIRIVSALLVNAFPSRGRLLGIRELASGTPQLMEKAVRPHVGTQR